MMKKKYVTKKKPLIVYFTHLNEFNLKTLETNNLLNRFRVFGRHV